MTKGDPKGRGRTGIKIQLLYFRAYGTWGTLGLTPSECVHKPWETGDIKGKFFCSQPKSQSPMENHPLTHSDLAFNFCPQFISKVSPVDPPETLAYSCLSRWQVEDFAKSWNITVQRGLGISLKIRS